MTVEYQDFGIGKRNTSHTVAKDYTGTLGRTQGDLKDTSGRVLADVLKAFGFELFVNSYTGERNFATDRQNPLAVTIKIANDMYMGTNGIELYEHKKSWGMRRHRNWLPMKADYIDGRTILVQDLAKGYRACVIEDGVVIKDTFVEQRSIAPTPDQIAKWL